jgi:hypothetical protein
MKVKQQSYSHLLIACMLAIGILYIVSCEKDAGKPPGNNKVELTSTTAGVVSYFSTSVSATITSLGGNTISDHGFCYGTSPNPDINASVKSLGKKNETGDFTTEISGMNDNTKYYVRAYVTFSGGTLYGSQKEIITLKTGKPHITTNNLSSITPVTAVCEANIVSDSGYAVTVSGFCCDTDNQFDEIQCLGKAINANGTTKYSLSITGLTDGTPYFIKAYATNQKGSSYGEIRQFTTLTITKPTVTTTSVSGITINSASSGGNVTNSGSGPVTMRGVCWSTSPNPTTTNSYHSSGSGTGTYSI